MSVKEARTLMEGVIDIPTQVEKLKKEAGRKAIMKVNAIMAQITKSVAEAAQAEAFKKVERELGLRAKKLEEIRALGKELEKEGKEIDNMKAQGKFEEVFPLNAEFYKDAQILNEKIKEQKQGALNLKINIDAFEELRKMKKKVSIQFKINMEGDTKSKKSKI